MGLILARCAFLCLIPAKWLGAIDESINFRTTARLGFWCLAGLVGALISLAFVVGIYAKYQNANWRHHPYPIHTLQAFRSWLLALCQMAWDVAL